MSRVAARPKALTVADVIGVLSALPQGSLLFRHDYDFDFERSTHVEHVTGISSDGQLEFNSSAADHWLHDDDYQDDADDSPGFDFEPDLVDFAALYAKAAAEDEADRAEDETIALAKRHGFTID